MNVPVAYPRNRSIPDVPHSALEICGVAYKSRDIPKSSKIEVWTNHQRLLDARRQFLLIRWIAIDIVCDDAVNVIIIDFVSHELIVNS